MATKPHINVPPMVSIDRRIYEVGDEPANVMSPQFDELTRVILSNHEPALLYQCARTGRLAVALSTIDPSRPVATYLKPTKAVH